MLKHFENMNWSYHKALKVKMYDEKSFWLFRNFLPSGTYFTKQITATHRNTFISHMICLEFAFTPVCIVSDKRLFVNKGNLPCMSELQFSHNHNYVDVDYNYDFSKSIRFKFRVLLRIIKVFEMSQEHWILTDSD